MIHYLKLLGLRRKMPFCIKLGYFIAFSHLYYFLSFCKSTRIDLLCFLYLVESLPIRGAKSILTNYDRLALHDAQIWVDEDHPIINCSFPWDNLVHNLYSTINIFYVQNTE